MKPNDQNNDSNDQIQSGKSDYYFNSPKNTSKSQEAAAKIIRSQIDHIFEENPNSILGTDGDSIKQPNIESANPYERTHTDTNAESANRTSDWQEYHTAWQDYYKRYYEGYYKHHYERSNEDKPASKEEEIFDLRHKIVKKIHTNALKIRKSRHFMPILVGLAVVLVLLFLQYNQLFFGWIATYVSPGNLDQQSIVINPDANTTVSAENLLIIPKINVSVPVIYGVGSDYDSQMAAMSQGVAQFAIPGANAYPGEVGNTVIAGHSSNDWLDSGDYKFIFAQLDKLVEGDIIYINYNSTRYTYKVAKKEVVKPTDTAALIYKTSVPVLTLVTCTPVGTATNRLLVTAEQISPNPETATASSNSTSSKTDSMPGNSKTFFEKLFSGQLWK